eukprot:g61.t1
MKRNQLQNKLAESTKEIEALHQRLLRGQRLQQGALHSPGIIHEKAATSTSEIGHVFVVRGSILNLHCDATLGFAREQPNELTYAWFQAWLKNGLLWRGPGGLSYRELYLRLYAEAIKAKRITPDTLQPNLTPHQSSGTIIPTSAALKWPNDQPLFCSFTVHKRKVVELCKAANRALKAIHAYCKRTRGTPTFGAHKFTYLISVVGGSTPEFQEDMGQVLQTLLESLNHSAVELGCDIGLICWEKSHYFMLQSLRINSRMAAKCFASIHDNEQLKAEAARLAELAGSGQLVIFLGAGASMGAGLPSWGQLLKELASTNAVPPIDTNSEEWNAMDMLTQADILDRRTATSLGRQIASAFSRMPCTEYVTTNYDTMMESSLTSYEDAPAVSVLPHQMVLGAETWVLKMHGCVTDPERIVLTRKDYMRYADRAAALSGIVQAKLMTKHMLFVGFSLTDDNFYRIADTGRAFHKEELWSEQLSFINCGVVTEPFSAAVRRHNILLDYISALANSHACPILDPRFHNVISNGQRKLSQQLQTFLESLDSEAVKTKEFGRLERVIRDLQTTDLEARAKSYQAVLGLKT